MLNDDELLRYSRHLLLPGMDVAGQHALQASRVLVLGAGGLGSATLLYLAAAGVGHIVVSDPDAVELSNLQRQIAHTTDRIGRNKASSARRQMLAQNPTIRVDAISSTLSGEALLEAVAAADAVVVGTDTLSSRLAVNAACIAADTPLVHAAAIGWEGQLAVFRPADTHSPCLACLYPPGQHEPTMSCSDSGVIAPLVGILGACQALETLKLLAGTGTPALSRLQLFDALQAEWHDIRIPKRPACPACSPLL